MPHDRLRYLEGSLLKSLNWSPTVSLLGMRQVGKTTLLRKLCRSYLTLDDDETAMQFSAGDWSRLESLPPPLALDECQKAVGLFDRIKLIVDRNRKPGQYVLTGSVRFLSKRQIRESLTGRTSILELLPMTLAESHNLPQNDFIASFLRLDSPAKTERFVDDLNKKPHRFSPHQCMSFLDAGGLPGIAFRRDAGIRKSLWNTQLETLLSRDIQQLYPTQITYQKLRTLFVELARQQSLPVNQSQLARQIGVSAPTIRQLLLAFEGLFLIRPVGKTYYCEDQGLATHALGSEGHAPLFQLQRLLFQELFSQLSYQFRGSFTLSHAMTRGGVHIPFLIDVDDGKKQSSLAFVADDTEGAADKSQKSLTWFKRSHPKIRHLIVLHTGPRAYQTATGILCVPFHRVF